MLGLAKSKTNKYLVLDTDSDGKPTGAPLISVGDRAEAEKYILAQDPTLTAESLKSIKCWDDYAYSYVPWGVTTLKDAQAAKDAQESAHEIQELGQTYNQIVNNILGSSDVKDKAKAITSLADEFAAELKDEVSGDSDEKKNAELKANSGFLVSDKDGDHLPTKKDGKLDHGLMGAAWAALHEGFRGNKYEGSGKDKALAKLKKLYKDEGLDTPKSAADYMGIKSLPNNRVGSYAVLWGTEDRRDLTEEYFDQSTEELTAVFDAVGRLPFIYHHGLDEEVKTKVIGVVDVLKSDSTGLWYEAQLKMADEYDEAIKQMFDDKRLKTSSQTFAVARRVNSKSGHIERWPIVEITATPTPAEHRMPAIEVLKSAFDEIGSDFGEFLKRYSDDKTQGAEKARASLSITRLRLANL